MGKPRGGRGRGSGSGGAAKVRRHVLVVHDVLWQRMR